MDVTQNDSANEAAPEQAAAEESAAVEQPEQSEPSGEQPAEDVPQPRSAEPDPEPAPAAQEAGGGKAAKKRKTAPKSKTAAGTKSLVVFREGKVHYADESVVVLDLDDAANPDTDVHDVVDKLSELRDAVESPGRAEAVTLIGELIQAKALA
ncbi:MAG TPA: hypothetical protein VL551_03850 [Actinospica sp.]|jgi:hypothetical protein|nr:hypothetical protein [Actinospica sp.]